MVKGCYCAGLFATFVCTAAGITPSRAADATVPRMRMPDPLLSLRDMYPEIASRAAGATQAHASLFPTAAVPAQDVRLDGPSTGRATLPMTSAWQRLGEYRAPGGVRLLTVWRATAGTVALHAGRHGGPSLQWTSPISAHGASPSGLFDHLIRSGGSSTR